MRYKTLFTLLVRAVGVLLVAEGVSYWLPQAAYVVSAVRNSPSVSFQTFHTLLYPTIKSAIGLYLFLDGRWVVNKAFPNDRPYCPECGYELTGVISDRCPECGHTVESQKLDTPGDEDARAGEG